MNKLFLGCLDKLNAKIFLVLLFLLPLGFSYADHGSGGGTGSCGGDCTAPTLGEDNSGKQFVAGGLGINGKFFDVKGFKQDIPTQTLTIGEPNEIIIKVYENKGVHQFAHASLMLGLENEIINGISVTTHPVTLTWEKTFDGTVSVNVDDKNSLLADIDISSDLTRDIFGNEDNLLEITFSFVPLQNFDPSVIIVQIWDQSRNSWTNYFYDAFEINSADTIISQIEDISIKNPNDDILVIPTWLKLNAQLWSQNQLDDSTFVEAIKYCIDNKIMNIPNLPNYQPEDVLSFVDVKKGPQYYLDRYYNEPIYRTWFDENFPDYTIEQAVGLNTSSIPAWVKNNADLWANNMISDSDFVVGIEYLVKNGIIVI